MQLAPPDFQLVFLQLCKELMIVIEFPCKDSRCN